MIVASATGTLIRKIARHVHTPISQPPISGPVMNEIPLHAVQVPIAAPRSPPENVDVRIASDAGVRSAPARPWSPRKTISVVEVGAAAQRADATPKLADADHEHADVSEDVAERAADEDERSEREQIRVDDPLLRGQPAAEVGLDRRQRHVHDGRVDEHDRRAQDRRHDGEPGGPAGEPGRGRGGGGAAMARSYAEARSRPHRGSGSGPMAPAPGPGTIEP